MIMNKKTTKKAITLFLVFCMVFLAVPTSAMAATKYQNKITKTYKIKPGGWVYACLDAKSATNANVKMQTTDGSKCDFQIECMHMSDDYYLDCSAQKKSFSKKIAITKDPSEFGDTHLYLYNNSKKAKKIKITITTKGAKIAAKDISNIDPASLIEDGAV